MNKSVDLREHTEWLISFLTPILLIITAGGLLVSRSDPSTYIWCNATDTVIQNLCRAQAVQQQSALFNESSVLAFVMLAWAVGMYLPYLLARALTACFRWFHCYYDTDISSIIAELSSRYDSLSQTDDKHVVIARYIRLNCTRGRGSWFVITGALGLIKLVHLINTFLLFTHLTNLAQPNWTSFRGTLDMEQHAPWSIHGFTCQLTTHAPSFVDNVHCMASSSHNNFGLLACVLGALWCFSLSVCMALDVAYYVVTATCTRVAYVGRLLRLAAKQGDYESSYYAESVPTDACTVLRIVARFHGECTAARVVSEMCADEQHFYVAAADAHGTANNDNNGLLYVPHSKLTVNQD